MIRKELNVLYPQFVTKDRISRTAVEDTVLSEYVIGNPHFADVINSVDLAVSLIQGRRVVQQ